MIVLKGGSSLRKDPNGSSRKQDERNFPIFRSVPVYFLADSASNLSFSMRSLSNSRSLSLIASWINSEGDLYP